MARYEVTIAGWSPASLNTLTRHWSRAHRAKASDRDRVAQELDLARVPRVAVPRSVLRGLQRAGVADPTLLEGARPTRRRLEVTVILGPRRDPDGTFRKGGQPPDPDNLLKSLLDALVEGGFLVDDSADWAEWECPRVVPDDGQGYRTRIVLEDQ
ncbi:hypothetical protein AB1L88_15810 [Tautonia sp. JC769]|uniref:hypothetical protein n=1 Tax=Tautonia sp. JC769 TaxID=3232135 RepID=UPI003457BF3B